MQPAWGVQGWYHESHQKSQHKSRCPAPSQRHGLRQLAVQAVERVRITVQLRRLQAAAQASAEPPQPENGEVPTPAPDSFARPPPDDSALKSPFVLASARTSSEQPSQDLLTKSSSGRFNPDGGNADRLAAPPQVSCTSNCQNPPVTLQDTMQCQTPYCLCLDAEPA